MSILSDLNRCRRFVATTGERLTSYHIHESMIEPAVMELSLHMNMMLQPGVKPFTCDHVREALRSGDMRIMGIRLAVCTGGSEKRSTRPDPFAGAGPRYRPFVDPMARYEDAAEEAFLRRTREAWARGRS